MTFLFFWCFLFAEHFHQFNCDFTELLFKAILVYCDFFRYGESSPLSSFFFFFVSTCFQIFRENFFYWHHHDAFFSWITSNNLTALLVTGYLRVSVTFWQLLWLCSIDSLWLFSFPGWLPEKRKWQWLIKCFFGRLFWDKVEWIVWLWHKLIA